MDPSIVESQKQHDMMAAFWPRKLSPYVTSFLVHTPITPNQTTVLWGLISVANSFLVYEALTGRYAVIPLIPLVYVITFTLDCVDGEIARYRRSANPVGGKLLDGICHRATEYSLLTAFVLGAYATTKSLWTLPIAALLFSGDAMYSYVYERRLTTLRLHGFTGRLKRTEAGVYKRGTSWTGLTRSQRIRTITGQLQYKSIYPVIALSYISPSVLLAGLAALAAYKHWCWMRLVQRTLRDVARGVSEIESHNDSQPDAVTAQGAF